MRRPDDDASAPSAPQASAAGIGAGEVGVDGPELPPHAPTRSATAEITARPKVFNITLLIMTRPPELVAEWIACAACPGLTSLELAQRANGLTDRLKIGPCSARIFEKRPEFIDFAGG